MHQAIGTRRGIWEGGAVPYSYCFFRPTGFIRPLRGGFVQVMHQAFTSQRIEEYGARVNGAGRAGRKAKDRRPEAGAERGGAEPPAIRRRPQAAPNRHLGAFLDLLWPAAAGTISISNDQYPIIHVQGNGRGRRRGGGRGGRRGFGAARGWRGPCRRIRRRRPGRRAFRVRRRKPGGPFRGGRFP